MRIYSKELGRVLLLGVAENRFSEENLDYLHVWAPEIDLKCLAAIDFGREILFQQNSNIVLNCFSPMFSFSMVLFCPAILCKHLYYCTALSLFDHMSASFNQFWGYFDGLFISISSHVWMWELDYKESWAPKNGCFWTVVVEETLESPLDCKEIQPVHPKENQSWIFIGRTDAEADTPILWPPDVKSWVIWKDPDAGKDWGWEEKGTTGWGNWMASPTRWTWVWLNSGVGGGQGGLECFGSRGCKESDTTEQLNRTELTHFYTT